MICREGFPFPFHTHHNCNHLLRQQATLDLTLMVAAAIQCSVGIDTHNAVQNKLSIRTTVQRKVVFVPLRRRFCKGHSVAATAQGRPHTASGNRQGKCRIPGKAFLHQWIKRRERCPLFNRFQIRPLHARVPPFLTQRTLILPLMGNLCKISSNYAS